MSLDKSFADSSLDLLSCKICLDSYDELERIPKLLSCHHSFCMLCLTTVSNQQKMITCPTCRDKTVLPPGGVSKLQTNFYVAQMKEVIDKSSEIRDKSLEKLPSCAKHEKALDLFCSTCERSLCIECQAGDHAGHLILQTEEAIEIQRRMMQSEIASSWNLVLAINKLRKSAEAGLRFLLASKRCAVENLHAVFGLIEESLRQRKCQLLVELNEAFSCRNDVLTVKLEDVKNLSSALGGVIDTCQHALTSTNIDNLVAHRVKLSCKTREMKVDDESVAIPQLNSLSFCSENSGDLINSIRGFGGFLAEDPIPCCAVVKDSSAIACQMSTISLVIEDLNNVELKCHYPLEVEVTDQYNDVIPCSIDHNHGGQYFLTFCPHVSGQHHVAISLWYYVITSCTVTVLSNDPVLVYGSAEVVEQELQYPRDVAVDNATGNVYVADSGNNRLVIYSRQGSWLHGFPISSDDDYTSCGIAVDEERRMIVCSEVLINGADLVETKSILKFSLEGQPLSKAPLGGMLRTGLSLSVNSLGQTVIADSEQDLVFIYDAKGRFLKRIGESGTGRGQFQRPTFVCVGSDDAIVVTDSGNSRIQVFDRTGRFVYCFGEIGNGKGQFNLPFGVTTDRFGNVLVVDGANNRVQVFGKRGKFVGCIESLGDKMNAPRGIDVTCDGHVLVADRDNHCIKKYKYL